MILTVDTDWDVVLLWPWHPWLYVVMAVAAILAVLWTLRSLHGVVSSRVRWGAAALRGAVLSLAVLAAALPTLQRQSVVAPTTRVAVAIDASQSMAVKNTAGISRYQRAVRLAEETAFRLKRSARFPVIVDFYQISGELEPIPDPKALESKSPEGPTTRLPEAVRRIAERYERTGDLGAILLLSDGIDSSTTPSGSPDPAGAGIGSLRLPVSTVAIGGPESLRDVSIVRVDAPPYAFVGDPVEVTVHVAAPGYEAKGVEVELFHQGSLVQRLTAP